MLVIVEKKVSPVDVRYLLASFLHYHPETIKSFILKVRREMTPMKVCHALTETKHTNGVQPQGTGNENQVVVVTC